MFILMLNTGLHVSELISSDIKDYDFNTHSVVVTRKGGDIQEVYYSYECGYYLTDYFEYQKAKYALRNGNFPAFTTTNIYVKAYKEEIIESRNVIQGLRG